MVEQATPPPSRATLFGNLPADLDVESLLGAVSDFILALDKDGRYLWAAATNPRAEMDGLLAVAQERARWLIGRTLYDVFPEPEGRRLLEAVQEALRSGVKQTVTYTIDPWDVGQRSFEATITRFTEDSVLWAARDITDARRAHDELEAWRDRHLSLVNSLDAIVWEADVPFTRFTFVSDQAERLLGYPVERWLSEPHFWQNHMHPEDISWCVPFCEAKTAAGEAHDFEYRMIAADGRTVWLRDIVTVVEESGRPVSLRGVMVDITSLKESVRRLSEQEQQYRSVFESTGDSLLIHSFADGYPVVTANPAACAMWGYPEGEIAGLTVDRMFSPDDPGVLNFASDVRNRRVARMRTRAFRRDGAVFDIESTGVPFTVNEEPHLLCIQRDITEQVRYEQVLEAKVEARTRELETLLQVSQALASTLDMESLLDLTMEHLRSMVPCLGSSVAIVENDALVTVASRVAPGRKTADAALGVPIPLSRVTDMWKRIEVEGHFTVDDVAGDSPEARAYREVLGDLLTDEARRYIRSWMGVPLRVKDRIIGFLSVSTDRPGAYTEEHARLARTVGAQTALAVENARLYGREHDRNAELATLLTVARNVASTLELESLLNVILEQVRVVADYDRASFAILDGDELEVMAVEWAGEPRPTIRVGMRIPTKPAPDLWALLASGQPVVLDDVHDDSPLSLAYRRVVTRGDEGIHSWMGIPLMSKGEIIGMLALSRSTPAYFTADHARLARAFADQAAVAIENARLYSSLEDRTLELESLLEVARGIASTLNLDELVRLILDQMNEVVEHSASSLILLDGDEFVVFDSRGEEGTGAIGLRFPMDSSDRLWASRALTDAAVRYPCVQAASSPAFWSTVGSGKHVIIDDAQAPGAEASQLPLRSSGGSTGVRSWMAIPLALKDRVIGFMGLASEAPGAFTADHARLARAFADQAAVAIENARLYDQAQKLAAVEERQRLARELHDSVSQALYGIALGSRTARTLLDKDPATATEPLDYVLALAEAGLAEMRALIFDLQPESLENEGLIGAVQRHVVVMEARHDIAVETVFGDEPDAPLPVKEAVYRIVRESLHNVVKHSRASNVKLTLRTEGPVLAFSVEDDGLGFDPAQSFPGHVGLASMRERATRLGGSLEIESSPGHGATVRGSIPLPPA